MQLLALERRLLKDQAIEALWPETDPVAGANNLYRTLYSLRQTLDTQLGAGASAETVGFDDAIAGLRTLLAQDSVDEPVHRELMHVYAEAGQRHEALRQYQACVDVLADELDAPPSRRPRRSTRGSFRRR